jgi:hypothetical protein
MTAPRRGGSLPASTADRWLLAVAIVLVDVVVFVVPVTGLLAAWVILGRPGWFRRWVDELYASPVDGPGGGSAER